MLKQSYLVCSAAMVLAVAACSDSTGVNTITQADANQLAADMDAVATFSPTDFGQAASFSMSVDPSGASASVASAPFPINAQFTVTKACPRGGRSRSPAASPAPVTAARTT